MKTVREFFLRLWFRKCAKILCKVKGVGEAKKEFFCYKFVKNHLKWKNSLWSKYLDVERIPGDILINQCIFVYWNQGFDNAPPIVKKCLNSIKENAGSYRLVCLDGSNVMDYVDLPDHILKKHDQGLIQEAHFSDLVRADLLYRYGGIWCDATCFLSKPVEKIVLESPFFVFQNSKLGVLSPIKCSNWFIKANQQSYLLKSVLCFLFEYYRHYDSVIHYYLFHIVLSALVEEDEECKKLWDDVPYICNMNPHVLQFSFEKKYSQLLFENVLNGCFVHKLTYKYNKDLVRKQDGSINVLQHLLST